MPGSRSRSRSPRRRSPSPRRRRSSSPRRRRSPPRRRPSPRRKSSPRRRSRSKSRSPRRFGRRSRSGSPGRPSPRRRSPIRRRSSARRKSGSPRRSPGGPRSRERPLVREAESTVKEERSRAPVSGPAGDRGARARRESPLDRSPPPKRVKDLSPPGRGARDRSPSPYGGGPGGYSPLKDTDHRKSSFEQQPDYNEDKDYRRIGDFSESQQAKRYDQTEIILHSRITSYGDDPVNFVPEDIITIGIERNILGNQPADVMQSYNPDEVVITRKKDEGAKALYQRDEFLGAAEEEYVEKRVIKVQPQQQRRKSPEVIRRENFEVRRDRFARGDEDAAVSLSDRFSGAGHGDKDERFRSAHASSSITRGDRDERVVLERGASDIYGDEDLRLKLRGDRGREKTRGRFEADPKDLRHNLARKRTVKDEDVDARRRIVDKRKSEHEDLPDFSRRPGMIKHKGDSGELPDFSRRPGMMGKHKGEGGDLPDFSRRPDKGRFEEWREKPEMIPKGGSYYEHDNRGETGSDDFFSRRGGGRGRGRGRGRGTRGGGRGDGGGRGGYDRFRKRCDECDGEGCDECYVDTVYEDETSGRTIDDAIEIISDGSLPPNEDDWDFYDEILSDNDEFGSNLSGVDKSYGRGLSPIASDPSQDKYLEIESERERHRMSMLDVCYGCYKSIRHKFGDPDCPALLRNGDSMMTVFSSYTEALSNYHRAPFEAFGHNFSSVHQAWLWKKASSLGMQNFAGQLKDAASALEATKYCQELEDDAQWNEWDTRNQHIMQDLLRLKAEQYARFRVELKNTKTMIAAASTDKFWGTGMLASATIKTKPEYWSGKNVLGDMLVDLRQEIKAKGDSYQEKKPDRVYRKKSLSPQPAISRAVDKDVCIACRVKGHKPGGAACSAKNFGSEKITLLSMKDKSRLSPFYPGKLQYSSLTFPSAVQAWLWKKATLMDYVKLANMSLDAPSPAKAFKTAMDLNMTTKRRRKWDEWDSDHWHVLEEVMRMRYEQSASFRQELMNTKGTVIGCTDVVNKDWGTGLTAGESKFTLSSFWPRPNKLGKILMKLRDSPPVAEKEKEAVLTEVREPVLCGDCNQFYHKVGEKCPKVNDGIVPISIVTFTTNAISLGYWSPLEVFRHKFQSILHAFSWKKANALGYCQLARKILECHKNAELTEIINTAAEAKRKEWFEWDKGNLPMMKIIMSKAILNNARAAKTLKEVTGEIGFATTADSFWGTGLNRVDTQRIMPQYWPGENMYGKILQEFREGGVKCDICDKFGHPAFDRECRGYNSGVVQIIAFHDDLVDSKNYHPLSMHHLAPISVFNQRFTSVFHAFTWKKCVNLGMVRLATQIKNTIDFDGINKLIEDSNVCSDPALRWDDKEKDNTHFMKSILKGKAQQNKEFFGALRDTKNRKVAFAVKDCFWGTGLSRANTKETLPDYWPGKNMYGTLLLALRDEILVCKLCGKRGHVDGDSDCPAFNSDTKITLVLDSHSTLSNLHNTPVQVFSNRFPSAHQAWLYKKVTSLGLHRLAHQVISEECGDDAQQLVEETGASQDPSFDWQRWDVSHVGDMKSIIKTKAVQNENFRRALNNAEKMIALSIPDKFWGTGMNHELTARIMPEYWPGKNMMGTLLMEVREEVLKCGICHRTGHEENSRFCPALNTGEVDVHVFIHHQNVVSPFYSAPLEVYGHKFGAAHLAFLWKKCSDLRLNRLAQQVLTARHPGEIRMTVDTFIKSMMPDVKIRWERWDRENQEVMRHIIESKSEQTKHFNPDLQKTEGILAYPVDDKYWGTGLSTDLTKSILPEYWPGKNMLGQLLMEHRGVLSMCKACQKPGHELGSRTCPGLNSGQVPTTVISHHQHPLSNWFKHPLAIFEQKFLSAEQAWLWKKAAEMGHADVAEKILDVQTAGEAHRVIFEKGLEADLEWRKWDEAQYDLMKAVVRSKLEQCPPFRKRLKEVDSILACATTSKYWGTALNRVETRRTLPDFWPGQNMFGKLLTEIRQDIINKAIQ